MEGFKYNDILKETMLVKKLQNGLNCYIIPKKEYVEKQAIICTNYGSIDNSFFVDGKLETLPDGIAHFLEHKLFENENKIIFEEFVKLGGNVNAFTNYTNTAYYFNCTDNFNENLKLLLEFTQTPYFTDENVEKEKGIIEQEINMYLDNPFLKAYLNMQSCLYHTCPVKNNIAGSVNSIKEIDKDMLYLCYNSFYFPENMSLICVGDFQENEIFEVIDQSFKSIQNKKIKREYGIEPKEIVKKYIEEEASVPRPIFNIGFKENNISGEMVKRIVSTKILMDVLAGQSSEFSNQLYEKSIIDGPFGMEYLNSKFYGSAVFSGFGENPQHICDLLLEHMEKVKKSGVKKDRFNQIKNKHIGRYIRCFNNIDYIGTSQVEMFSKGIDLFDIIDSYNSLTLTDVEERLSTLFHEDNFALSVVIPFQS